MESQQKLHNGTDIRLILVITGVFLLSQITTFFRIYARLQMDGLPIDLWGMIQDRLVSTFIGFIFLTAIVVTTRRFLLEQKSWPKTIVIHLLIAALVSLIWYATFIFVHKLVSPSDQEEFKYFDFLYWFLLNFDKLFLLYLCTTIITYAYYYVQRDRDNKINQSKMANQLLSTRLKMLQSQLHPHFLFNTLNSIISLMDVDIRKAKTMTTDLADLLRHVLANKDEQMVKLEEEIEVLAKYVDIEKTRFSDDLEINWITAGNFRDVQIPNMLLQPLVENSIKHGFSRQHPRLRIEISIVRNAERLRIQISDNGQGFSEEVGLSVFARGTGIRNTQQRLQSLYGEDFTFTVESTGAGVINTVDIPVRQSPADDQLAAVDPPKAIQIVE